LKVDKMIAQKDPIIPIRKAVKAEISTIDAIIADIAIGKPVLMVDDENRENEGDLIIAAEKVTAEAINFMITWCRGLVCLPLHPDILDRLELPMMVAENSSQFGTAFTVSIGAKEGITTGISPADRAATVQVAIADDTGPSDISTPGHVFPLRAQAGGVLKRAGHTEAAIDLARLAGLKPAGVICEIIRDDGEMARLDDLKLFAAKYDIKIGTIADLITYREENSQ
jgi:3,4-dihydroxy 2-butanone 4-phosphate synthase/GTP cyclohydrolase II